MGRFDLQPHLIGQLLELRPMHPEHWERLFAVAADPLIWEVHPARERYKEEHFRDYFQEGLASRYDLGFTNTLSNIGPIGLAAPSGP